MSWIRRFFQIFKTDDNDEFEYSDPFRDEEHEVHHTNSKNDHLEGSGDIDTKVFYQYPKGQFKFPLIPDEPLEIKERISKRHKQNQNQSPLSQSEQYVDSKVIEKSHERHIRPQKRKEEEQQVHSRRPFRPTEIPSPIYGFNRPNRIKHVNQEEVVEFELHSFTPGSEIADSNTSEQIEERTEMPAYEEIELLQELDIVEDELLVEENPINPPVFEDTNVNETIIGQTLYHSEVDTVAEEEDIQNETAPKVTPNEEALISEKKEKGDSRRSNLPFNVIMLKKDKRRIEQKSPEPFVNPYVAAGLETSREEKQFEEPQAADRSQTYEFPITSLLNPPAITNLNTDWLHEQEDLLNETLMNFNVGAKVVNVTQGPAVTRFEVQPEPGVKVNKITNLSDDIKLSLAAKDIRIEAPIPGKHTIGIEVPNQKSRPVFISEIINSKEFIQNESPLTAVLGLDISGKPIVTDLRKMPHGLIAGATGSGKSVCINSILVSLLFKATPDELKLLLIDPKMVELAPYNQIPHLVSPVITDVKAATAALKWAVDEMERRYELFAHTGVRDITRFNEVAENHKRYSDKLPYILIIIDELADLMMMSPADVEEAICRIAQKARACGIHLIIATQRPSVDVITGLIKANVPTRIAFSVSSQVDSRTIIDIGGAEKLLGRGDMLFLENGSSKPVRLQGTFVSDMEIDDVVAHVREQREPDYLFQQDDLIKKAQITEEEDELFYEACEFVVDQGGASTSSIQRRFKIGYNRAARLIDMMEQQGFISEARGSKPRDVLITEDELESFQESNNIF
ncbi:DNA translocase FtsK [Bacillus massilinigeriensis]|uniref:DNA translocase FtsK n=1 Tax=Bacillus massilionigeriensis TaxID=1805475 RepID=UPI00096B2BA8|nr:DNA translocase FtsK [Bacillus massilionigeriensis]